MKAARIALVDDEAAVRVALARLLRLSGYDVRTYATGEEFLAAVGETPADCALLDVHLPGLTGVQVQQRLHSMRVHMPAVFITASEEFTVEHDAPGCGVRHVLRKPFSADAMCACIESLLTRVDDPGL